MPIEEEVIEEAKVRVRNDVVEGFHDALTPDGDSAFQINLADSSLDGSSLDGDINLVGVSESLVMVPWVFHCVHTGPFLNVPATYVHFDLRGTTLVNVVSENYDDWDYYRYVDFLCALHHIGVSTNGRPALEPDAFVEWTLQRTGPPS